MTTIDKRENTLANLAFVESLAFNLETRQRVIFADVYSKTFWISELDAGRYANFEPRMSNSTQIDTTVAQLLAAGWDQKE
jgi:hypothetical protein